MNTINFICPSCPNCGAPIDISHNAKNTVCKYCGNTIFIYDSTNEDGSEGEKSLLSSLIERKFIYYIPCFNGINDCYNFILSYEEAVFLYKEKGDLLSKEEKYLVTEFFKAGYDYIKNSSKENIELMVYTQMKKYYTAFSILSKEINEFHDFKGLETLFKNQIQSLSESQKKEETADQSAAKFGLIVLIVILFSFIILGFGSCLGCLSCH